MRLTEHWASTALEASARKPSTKDLYRTLAYKHLTPAPLGLIPLDRLRKTHIDGLIVKLRTAGLSDSAVRNVYTVLRAVLDDAKLDGLIANNPAVRVQRPRVRRTEARHLSSIEVSAVLAAAKGLRHHDVLVPIAATGLRRGRRWRCGGPTSISPTAC